MAFSSGGGSAISDINVTPLVDVMLVLLIIFMVTTVATEEDKIKEQSEESLQEQTESIVQLNLPITPDNPLLADPETTRLVMVVDGNLRVFLMRGLDGVAGEEPIADCSSFRNATAIDNWLPCFDTVQKALGGSIDTANVLLKQEGIYLQADANAPYGFVAGLMSRLRELGVDQISIVTNPNALDDVRGEP